MKGRTPERPHSSVCTRRVALGRYPTRAWRSTTYSFCDLQVLDRKGPGVLRAEACCGHLVEGGAGGDGLHGSLSGHRK